MHPNDYDQIRLNYRTADLNESTWMPFERFFSKYNGVQECCWCVYYHQVERSRGKTLEERCNYNYSLKRQMVMKGDSRGLLIFKGDEVILSCQYGKADDFPRIDNMRRYKVVPQVPQRGELWRVSCFFVDRAHRSKNLTAYALHEVLEKISSLGGGIIEGFPVKGRSGSESWFGSMKIFLENGFEIISDFGNNNVLVRKVISTSTVEGP